MWIVGLQGRLWHGCLASLMQKMFHPVGRKCERHKEGFVTAGFLRIALWRCQFCPILLFLMMTLLMDMKISNFREQKPKPKVSEGVCHVARGKGTSSFRVK